MKSNKSRLRVYACRVCGKEGLPYKKRNTLNNWSKSYQTCEDMAKPPNKNEIHSQHMTTIWQNQAHNMPSKNRKTWDEFKCKIVALLPEVRIACTFLQLDRTALFARVQYNTHNIKRSKKMGSELRTCHVKSTGLASPPGLAYKSGFQRAILEGCRSRPSEIMVL